MLLNLQFQKVFKILFVMLLVTWFFALTINSITPQVINSPDDILIVEASASGLQSNTQYLQVAMTKDGETTDYLGLTKNQNGEWFQYKSSPPVSDLSTYFYNFTPVGGTWSGQISFKVDTTDSGFKGPGNYILKLLKYITSTVSYSANNFLVAINIASNSGTTTNPPAQTSVLTPSLDWDIGKDLKIGESFNLNLKLQNFESQGEYFLKIRGGTDENKLTKTQTKNGGSFLSDNENWSGFPIIKVDSSGKWEGILCGMISEEKDPGKYKIRVRARKKDTESFFESDLKELNFSKAPEEIISIAPPVVATKSSEKIATKAAVIPIKIEKKSSDSAVLGSSVSAEILSKQENNISQKTNPVAVVLGVGGFFLSLLSVWGIIIKRYGSQ